MKEELYNEIVDEIKRFRGLTRDCAHMLIHKYPDVSPNAIHGILSSEVRLKIKENRWKLHTRKHNYLQKYRTERQQRKTPPGIIVRMAAKNDLSPALFARVILERYLEERNPQFSKSDVSRYMKDTTQIPDPDLAYEIYLCVLYDDRNGMISDAFCNSVGHEYEVKLEAHLREKNIAYLTEDELRDRGYDKTPDIKLEIPIAVDGFIVNWIESKARFGTPSIHRTHVKEQFLSYWNRFGPGLVIYWCGYVDTLCQPGERKFMVVDDFPQNITFMNPLVNMRNLKLDDSS